MVGGCQIKKPCVVVDLDNTLIKGNSLIMLTRHLSKKLLREKKISDFLSLSFLVFKRKVRLLSHREMKHRILCMANDFMSSEDMENLGAVFFKSINPRVYDIILNYYNQGAHILLATAADNSYVPVFIKKLERIQLDYIATSFTSNIRDYIENRSENKLRRVEEYLKKNNLECVSVISDHYDDLPLFQKFSEYNYLVNPSEKNNTKA